MINFSIKYYSIPIFAAMYEVNVTSQAQLHLVSSCKKSGAGFPGDDDTHTDIVTYWMNRPRGRCSERIWIKRSKDLLAGWWIFFFYFKFLYTFVSGLAGLLRVSVRWERPSLSVFQDVMGIQTSGMGWDEHERMLGNKSGFDKMEQKT